MDFRLTDEQQMIQAAAREFAQNEIAPVAAKFDISGEFPVETIRQAGELGFMGIEIPEEYGGAALDSISFVLVIEEISAACAAHGVIVSVNNTLYGVPLLEFGTAAQKEQYLTPVASGQVNGAYALTEPQSGSDAAAMRSRAELAVDGSHYLINAKKSWITSGPVARYLVLFAKTDVEAKGSRGISAFIIDTEQEGFQRGKTEPKLGIRASATCEIELTDYRCPVENRLGEEGQGFPLAMKVLDAGRVGIAAQALGIAQAAYDAALSYSRERHAFGAPIGSFQTIQNKIADMKTRIEAARLLVYKAAWHKMQARQSGARNALNGSIAKL
ncbi:MAG: acyl-CoA dehydrogenase, partial [Woeseia sp.]|nr:acyl-CoA dehydrogenase [Woeseia sp.]